MFVSFAIDNGIRFTAHFYDPSTDKTETRPVSGWVTDDSGVSQATVVIPESGLQVRVGTVQGFLAVVPNGQEAAHDALIEAKIEQYKKQVEAAKSKTVEA